MRSGAMSVGTAVGSGTKKAADGASKAGSKAKQTIQNHSKKIIAAIITLLIIVLAILIFLLIAGQKQPTEDSCCATPACIEAASNILQNLHPSGKQNVSMLRGAAYQAAAVDPCEHFDKYVCGGFEKRFDLRPDQGEISTGMALSQITCV